MTTALDVARTQLGVQEQTGNNDGVPAERYMRGDELAWCAGFALWCLEQAGDTRIAPSDRIYYACRSVSDFIKRVKILGMWRSGGGYEPKPGDLVFFGAAQSDVGVRGNHMGIVEVGGDRTLHTIEGNTSNKVARRSYMLGDKKIIGYACL